jgi:branched-chain amino acid transport system permease protein
MVFTQLLVNSLIMGSIYALVGCGFSLIYATNKFMHFGHGVSVAVSAYALLALFSFAGVPFYLACLLTIILASLFGLGMYKGIYSPLQKRNASNVVLLIASLAIMVFFEFLLQLIFGPDIQSIGYITVAKGIEIFGARITPLQIVIIMVSFALLGILYFFMKKTKLGRNMRAVADNKELASIIGINQKRLANISFMIGSALAGVAGILIGLEQNLQPLMGTQLMVKGFTGAIIGGVTSVPGAIVGSYLLGIAENYGIWFLPSGYKNAIAFGLLFIFLLFKPSGLFGLNKGVKE